MKFRWAERRPAPSTINWAGTIIILPKLLTMATASLLSTDVKIDLASFYDTNQFEYLARYVFWTFNKSFLLKLLAEIENQVLSDLRRYHELLLENPIAYPDPVPTDAGEELRFCYMKNENLKVDPDYTLMYALDEEHRKALLTAVEKKMAALVVIGNHNCRIFRNQEYTVFGNKEYRDLPDKYTRQWH